MAVDYDLVVIGSSRVGIYAAQQAAQLQARTALVTQSDNLLLPDNCLIGQAIAEVGQQNYKSSHHPLTTTSTAVSLAAAQQWAKKVDRAIQTQHSLANLSALGVDVITAKGEFCRLPQLALQTPRRKLRSRKFLVATGTKVVPEFIAQDDDYLTLDELWQKDLTNLGQKIIVVGSNPAALELAQTLARFDKDVTLATPQPRILPREDAEVVLHLQAQLEAEGIKIYTNALVSQIKTIDGQKWLQAGDIALAGSEIIVADYRQPNIAGLNLEGVGVKCDRQRIYVNRRMQTSHPDIYACGDAIGGYSLPSIARYEANIALKNTLFLPLYRTNYHSVSWTIATQPGFARVGLTTKQAQAQYGAGLFVIKEYISYLDLAQISNCTTGMCKLLVSHNGEIVGCSLIGDRAEELIVSISLMIQHKIKLDSNPLRGLTSSRLATVYPSMSDIWQRASHNFYRQKLQQNYSLLNRLRSWHSWRKEWHK